ncbi:MAG: thiopurine S-methyltransferase, partial [Gammaproteobacteria bacterium]|nr:thiopurine S-methyltransferase [Gammaproteobacteria bacterium]
MRAKDWLDRWQQNRIGFHQGEVNASLQQYIDLFELNAGDRVFLPLCGKAHDIAWLAARGFEVIGIELSAIAIEAFFAEFEVHYQCYESDHFNVYESGNITLYQGDYFDLTVHD